MKLAQKCDAAGSSTISFFAVVIMSLMMIVIYQDKEKFPFVSEYNFCNESNITLYTPEGSHNCKIAMKDSNTIQNSLIYLQKTSIAYDLCKNSKKNTTIDVINASDALDSGYSVSPCRGCAYITKRWTYNVNNINSAYVCDNVYDHTIYSNTTDLVSFCSYNAWESYQHIGVNDTNYTVRLPHDIPRTCDEAISYYSGCHVDDREVKLNGYFKYGCDESHALIPVNYTLTTKEFQTYNRALAKLHGTVYTGEQYRSGYTSFAYNYNGTIIISRDLWRDELSFCLSVEMMLLDTLTKPHYHLETYIIMNQLFGPVNSVSTMKSAHLGYLTKRAYSSYCTYDNTSSDLNIFNLCASN